MKKYKIIIAIALLILLMDFIAYSVLPKDSELLFWVNSLNIVAATLALALTCAHLVSKHERKPIYLDDEILKQIRDDKNKSL